MRMRPLDLADGLAEVTKDLKELRELSGPGATAVGKELGGRLERTEQRLGEMENSFLTLRNRMEEV